MYSGACDTFRAAATEQLKSWADRLDLDIVSDTKRIRPLLLSTLIQQANPVDATLF